MNKGRLKSNSRKYVPLCETSTFDIWPVNLSHSWTWLSWWNQQRATWNCQRHIPLCTCQTVLFQQQQADSCMKAHVKGSSKNKLSQQVFDTHSLKNLPMRWDKFTCFQRKWTWIKNRVASSGVTLTLEQWSAYFWQICGGAKDFFFKLAWYIWFFQKYCVWLNWLDSPCTPLYSSNDNLVPDYCT